MFKMQVGQPRVGKTKQSKKIIENTDKKVLIFDFNNDYKDIDGKVLELENFHPLVDDLTLEEVKVINAGYLQTSRCLANKAEDIFREESAIVRPNIIKDTLERLHASWNDIEMEYAKELSERIPLKISPKQSSLNLVIDELEKNEVVIVRNKSIHSDHLRAMVYMIVYKISKREDLDVQIIADEISTLFFKGNLKLLFDVVDVKKIDLLISCNRASNIPKVLKDKIDEWVLFKNSDKSETRHLMRVFGVGRTVDFAKIPKGKFVTEIHNTKLEKEFA